MNIDYKFIDLDLFAVFGGFLIFLALIRRAIDALLDVFVSVV